MAYCDPTPPLFALDGVYIHKASGQMVQSQSNVRSVLEAGAWKLLGNGALGYNGNVVHLTGDSVDPKRMDAPKEMVPNLSLGLEVGKPFETVNGSQVLCIGKHKDGQFEVVVLKGGHTYGPEYRGHCPGSSYIVKPDGHLREMRATPPVASRFDAGGKLVPPFDCLRIARKGKAFTVTTEDKFAILLATEASRISRERAEAGR